MSGQSGPGSNGNEGVLCIPQSSSIIGTLPSDCLVSYPGHSLGGGSYPLCRGAVSIFYSPSRLDKKLFLLTIKTFYNNFTSIYSFPFIKINFYKLLLLQVIITYHHLGLLGKFWPTSSLLPNWRSTYTSCRSLT